MTARSRLWVFAGGAAGLAALLVWGFTGLPAFGAAHGELAAVLRVAGLRQTHATNTVTAIVFDSRGFDTLGEEFMLFAAVMGVAVLLRAQRGESEERGGEVAMRRKLVETSDAVRVAALALVTPVATFGLDVVVHGALTPGGGFQGGMLLAGAPLLVYLAGEYPGFRRLTPTALLDVEEAAGAAGFVVVGLVGLAVGGAFLRNVFPPGQAGSLFSAGTIPVINLAVGLEVAAGVVIVAWEYLEQTLIARRP